MMMTMMINTGWTPLIAAIDAGERAAAEQLLHRLGADVNQQEHDGWTPLMFAAFKGKVNSGSIRLGCSLVSFVCNMFRLSGAIRLLSSLSTMNNKLKLWFPIRGNYNIVFG